MTALEFVSFLDRYIADKPPNFGDGDSVLTLLYEAYNDANNMDSDEIKAGFRDLYKSMNGMPLREMDTIVNPVCALCRDYEQAGFVHGVEVGMLLAKEAGNGTGHCGCTGILGVRNVYGIRPEEAPVQQNHSGASPPDLHDNGAGG